jgi:hypothetical protein
MYVRDTDPLPCILQQPTQAQAAYDAQVVQNMENSVNNAYAASQMIAGPESFADFGPIVQLDVALQQANMGAANSTAASIVSGSIPSPSAPAPRGPRVFALNVDQAEYAGCSRGGASYLPARVQPPQPVTMPARVAGDVGLVVPASPGTAPKYSNLCWALHNGEITQDQFDLVTYGKLYRTCAALGYTQGCSPPTAVAAWIMQQRAAGTLPHINVSDAELAAIPHAPDMTNMGCSQALIAGGGMGTWGDAGGDPSTYGWPRRRSQMNWSALLFLGAVGVGLYVMAEKKSGRR